MRQLLQLARNPCHQKVDYSMLLFAGHLNPTRDLPPLGEAITTTAGASVLGFENRMTSHRSLLAVVRRVCRSESRPYKVFAMPANRCHPLLCDILPVRSGEVETAPELRLSQPRKCQIVILHMSLWDFGFVLSAIFFKSPSVTPAATAVPAVKGLRRHVREQIRE